MGSIAGPAHLNALIGEFVGPSMVTLAGEPLPVDSIKNPVPAGGSAVHGVIAGGDSNLRPPGYERPAAVFRNSFNVTELATTSRFTSASCTRPYVPFSPCVSSGGVQSRVHKITRPPGSYHDEERCPPGARGAWRGRAAFFVKWKHHQKIIGNCL